MSQHLSYSSLTPNILNVYTTPLEGHTLIEASAGTGKTWTISGLYTRLLLDETLKLNISEILVVTFTNPATAELRDRIRKRLSDVLDSFQQGRGVDEFCSRFLQEFQGDQERAIQKLTRAISNFDEASIFTIHSFCQRLLGEAAFESGADFGLEVILEEAELEREIVEDFWRKEIYAVENAQGSWFNFLQLKNASPQQWRRAVRRFKGRLTLERCPLVPLGELQAQEQQLLQQVSELKSLWIREHESLRDEVLPASKVHAQTKKAMLSRWPTLHEWFMKDQMHEKTLMASVKGGNLRESLEYFTAAKRDQHIDHPIFVEMGRLLNVADTLVKNYELKQRHLYSQLVDWLNQELSTRKAERQQMSADDLLTQVWQAVTGVQKEAFVAFVRRYYRAAMIDEFQDTDPIQCEIFESIFAETGLPLFFVGDPKQAIYGFRGADIHAYLAARKKVDNTRHMTLDTNQRSVPQLIQAVNTIFSAQQSAVPFMDQGIHFQPVKAADKPRAMLHIHDAQTTSTYPDAPFRFLMLPENVDKKGEPEPWSATKAVKQATEGVANEIAHLLNLGASDQAAIVDESTGLRRPLNGGDIAVLVSSARQAKDMQQQLIRRGIPSVRQARENVFETPEAQSLVFILTAIAQPTQQGLVRTALMSDLMGYRIDEVMAMMEDHQTWDRLLDTFVHWNHLWRDKGFMRMFRAWMHTPGSDGLTVAERLLNYVDGERRLTNLLHLAELIQAESRLRAGLEPLLSWFVQTINDPEEGENNDVAMMRLESDAQRVKIVTIHSSKGLEYHIVFCPYLFDGKLRGDDTGVIFHRDDVGYLDLGGEQFPQNRLWAARETLQENLRLLYVALTRAKHRCYVVWGSVSVLKALEEDTPNVEDLLEKGFHTASLTWLLHACPEQEKALDNPIAAMRNHCSVYTHLARVQQDLDQLKTHAEGTIDSQSLRQDMIRGPLLTEIRNTLSVAVFTRPALEWGWRVASFSGLTHGAGSKEAHPSHGLELPDQDTEHSPIVLQEEADSQILTVFNFPKGEVKASEAGTCLHNILEAWQWPDDTNLDVIIERELKTSGLKPHWKPVVDQIVHDTVFTPVTSTQCRLADIPCEQRLAEMEFTFPLDGFSVKRLQDILKHPDHQVDPAFIEATQYLSFETLQGYMRGYIDLIFAAENQYYVLDYKSNRLGAHVENYGREAMVEAMAHSHYYLQYLIYTVAVHRYLSDRLDDYRYERDMGGVVYLFLRGLGDRSGHYGVFTDRPMPSLIEALDQLLPSGRIETTTGENTCAS